MSDKTPGITAAIKYVYIKRLQWSIAENLIPRAFTSLVYGK